MNRSDQGFTLIEMSIVLVIIGLIVGGILVGQNLIKAATVRAEIKEIQDLETQINTFRVKYDCLPGDCKIATTFFGTTDTAGHTILNGDGNGLIRSTVYSGGASPYTSQNCVSVTIQGSELPQLFLQLDDAQLGNYPSDGYSYYIGKGWPYNKSGVGDGILVTCLSDDIGITALSPRLQTGNVIVYGAMEGVGGGDTRILYTVFGVGSAWGNPQGIHVDEAQMIDQKMDDGLPLSGNFGVVNTPVAGCLGTGNTAYLGGTGNCLIVVGKYIGTGE